MAIHGQYWSLVLQTSLKSFVGRKFWPIFGSRWPLFGPPWPSPGLPGLRFNSLDPQESGLDPVSANFRPQKIFATSEKSYLGVLPPKIDSYGLGTIIERSASKFCISGLRRRVKRSSWSNFMAMSIRFILQWRSRLHTQPHMLPRGEELLYMVHIWAIYGPYMGHIWPYMVHIWPYMAHIWPYMAIYGPYMAIYGPYMVHIWAIYDHIWAIYGPYMDHIYMVIYGPYMAIYDPYMAIYGHIWGKTLTPPDPTEWGSVDIFIYEP